MKENSNCCYIDQAVLTASSPHAPLRLHTVLATKFTFNLPCVARALCLQPSRAESVLNRRKGVVVAHCNFVVDCPICVQLALMDSSQRAAYNELCIVLIAYMDSVQQFTENMLIPRRPQYLTHDIASHLTPQFTDGLK